MCCGLAVKRRKPRSHTVRSGQVPHTPGGTKLRCGLAVSPGKPRPPTHPPRGKFWSCHGSGRFGDAILWSTRDTRGARGWDASAIPLRVGFVRHFYRTVFSAALLCGEGVVRVQISMIRVYLAHIKCVCHRRGHHTARSDTPMHTTASGGSVVEAQRGEEEDTIWMFSAQIVLLFAFATWVVTNTTSEQQADNSDKDC